MYQCTIVTVLEALWESWGFPQKYIRRKATLHQRKKHGNLIATISSMMPRSPNFALLLNLKHILRSRKLGSYNSSIPSYFPLNFRTSVLHIFLVCLQAPANSLGIPSGLVGRSLWYRFYNLGWCHGADGRRLTVLLSLRVRSHQCHESLRHWDAFHLMICEFWCRNWSWRKKTQRGGESCIHIHKLVGRGPARVFFCFVRGGWNFSSSLRQCCK